MIFQALLALITQWPYADDCKTYKTIETVDDHSSLLLDLNNLQLWSEANDMEFNIRKCKLMQITKLRMQLLGTSS